MKTFGATCEQALVSKSEHRQHRQYIEIIVALKIIYAQNSGNASLANGKILSRTENDNASVIHLCLSINTNTANEFLDTDALAAYTLFSEFTLRN